MNPGTPVRFGVVGLGRLGLEVHLPLLRALEGVHVTAVADPDPAALEAAREFLGNSAIRSEQPLDLCSGDAASCDALVIASPTRFHGEQAEAALDAGRHVYLEKPIATSREGAERLSDRRLSPGQVAQVGFNYRHDPAYAQLRRSLQRGTLGRPGKVSMTFTTPLDPSGTWRDEESSGGCALFDLFSHDADLLHFLGFRVERISARSRERRLTEVRGTLRWTDSDPIEFHGRYAFGERDAARCEIECVDGRWVYDRYRDAMPRRVARGGALWPTGLLHRSRHLKMYLERRRSPWRQASYRLSLRAFVESIHGHPSPTCASLRDGRASLEVVEAARRSLGQPTGLSPLDGRSEGLSRNTSSRCGEPR